jgi:hypothetical protein
MNAERQQDQNRHHNDPPGGHRGAMRNPSRYRQRRNHAESNLPIIAEDELVKEKKNVAQQCDH